MDVLTLFKALSDDTRLRLMVLLQQHGELCVCDLMQALALSQPKVSRHLARLRADGLLLAEKRGQWVYYRLQQPLPLWAGRILSEAAAACRAAGFVYNGPSGCCETEEDC